MSMPRASPHRYFLTSSLKRQHLSLVQAGKTVTVPGPGYGFDYFRAVPPLGKGRLITLVLPPDFPVQTFITAPVRSKGFAPERSTTGYFMNLLQQIRALIVAQRSNAGTRGPGFAVADQEYEIVQSGVRQSSNANKAGRKHKSRCWELLLAIQVPASRAPSAAKVPGQRPRIEAILVTELSRWDRSTRDLVETLDDLHGWNVLAKTAFRFDPRAAFSTTLLALASLGRLRTRAVDAPPGYP
jgi:hypothetical protein